MSRLRPYLRDRSDYPTEAEDGTPHLAYFAEDTSFVWSGNGEHPIQVCPGGYGEPVAATIWPADPHTLAQLAIPGVLAWFRRECDDWLRNRG